jgi:lambda repressor-like predicted transcriptional regulator
MEMRRRGMDMKQLASAIGYAFTTTENVMKKRSPPSEVMAARLRTFAAGGAGTAQEPAVAASH